jgi:hypothetical protein
MQDTVANGAPARLPHNLFAAFIWLCVIAASIVAVAATVA